MTTTLVTTPRSSMRQHILVPRKSGLLSAYERAAMMQRLPNCLRLEVEALPESVRRVRHAARGHVLEVFAADTQSPSDEIKEWSGDIEVVTSELITNAVRYKLDPGPIVVELAASFEGRFPRTGWMKLCRPLAAVKISVEDDNPKLPEIATLSSYAESGRGLVILDRQTAYADVVPTESGGKRVRAIVCAPIPVLAELRARREGK